MCCFALCYLKLVCWWITLSLASCGPLNAVLGRFSSFVFFSVGFFGRLARGPASFWRFVITNLGILLNSHRANEYSHFQAIDQRLSWSNKKLLTSNFHYLTKELIGMLLSQREISTKIPQEERAFIRELERKRKKGRVYVCTGPFYILCNEILLKLYRVMIQSFGPNKRRNIH